MQRQHATADKRRLRISLAIVLLAVAILWPFVDFGPHGSPMVFITHDHGIDSGDLLALIPLTLAIALVFSRSRSDGKRPPRPM